MFIFITKNFKEDAKNFSKYNFEKNYQKSLSIIFVGAIITLLLSIAMIILKESLWISIALLVCSAAILVYGYLFYKTLTRGTSNVALDSVSEVVTTFNKNNLEVITKYIDNGQASSILEYAQIEKIEESDQYFFLYLSKVNAFVLKKDAIENGTIAEFRKFLRKEKHFEIIVNKEKTTTKNRQRRRMENKK